MKKSDKIMDNNYNYLTFDAQINKVGSFLCFANVSSNVFLLNVQKRQCRAKHDCCSG